MVLGKTLSRSSNKLSATSNKGIVGSGPIVALTLFEVRRPISPPDGVLHNTAVSRSVLSVDGEGEVREVSRRPELRLKHVLCLSANAAPHRIGLRFTGARNATALRPYGDAFRP
jgi:hypothetical protein